MAGRNEIQQTIERILNLTADHINVSDGKLCFNIIGIVGSGGTHLTHVRIGGTGQQQRLRTLAGGTRIVRIGFKHLLVRGCGASVIALLCQHIRLLMLRRHLLLGAGSGSRVCRIGIRIAGIRRGTGHTGLLRGCDQIRNHRIHDLLHFLSGRQALQNRHRTAVDQREQCRRALHLERLRDRRIRRDIDTRQLNLAVQLVHGIAQLACHVEQAIIGRHPQQQQDRERGRRLHHGLERVLRGVDHITACGRSASSLPRFGLHLMLQRFKIDGSRQGNSRIKRPLTCHACLLDINNQQH